MLTLTLMTPPTMVKTLCPPSGHKQQPQQQQQQHNTPPNTNTNTCPECPACGGFIKPSIVFFGEGLPPEFAHHIQRDLLECDLLLVMGTSLKVQPVALIPELLPVGVPRVLFNRELVGDFLKQSHEHQSHYSTMSENEHVDVNVNVDSNNDNDNHIHNHNSCRERERRDMFEPGDCDDAVRKLCRLAGWTQELDVLHEQVQARERERERERERVRSQQAQAPGAEAEAAPQTSRDASHSRASPSL